MADGDNTAGGMGMGMIIGLLIVVLIVIVGGIYLFGGHGSSNPAGQVASAAGSAAGHTISGTATVQ